ncbi:MAG: hypothetical protein IJZ75_00260 [Clostridia bacterium]|nr:hypothetical protein [Clostridia bacterium]
MKSDPKTIFKEYLKGASFKETLGNKGLFEQTKINERFYVGDQWYGAKCGNDRPLVRYNVIKRIGDYKMSQIICAPISLKYSALGVASDAQSKNSVKLKKAELSKNKDISFSGGIGPDEINLIMSVMGDYRVSTANRIGLDSLMATALKKAFISGTGIIYTYWDNGVKTDASGDINCEVLDVENVFFADPYNTNLQTQPYIIIASRVDAAAVIREIGDGGTAAKNIKADNDGKVLVLTKFYKDYSYEGGGRVRCVKVTENCVIRKDFDTRLTRYPLASICWEERGGLAYGQSEVTYLIPNQIAINRMITANVWAAMTMGMPMMVVNGDTVTAEITNDPGQIIKVYGTNEDVAGAVKFITPPDFSSCLGESIKDLITNTLTQSGANEVALGDTRADNAAALTALMDAAVLPLQILRKRYYSFQEEIALIWADFWFTHYGNRNLCIEDENGVWYLPFDAHRYSAVSVIAQADVGQIKAKDSETASVLNQLYEKGILDKKQYVKRLPDNLLPDKEGILSFLKEEEENEGI